jgi:CRP-like cAMP-binding protein/CheY-like chemotaxis protein
MQTILLIEDNREVRENTAEILELAGYAVNTAADGKAGVESVKEKRPDLIICDIMMPVLDGYGVLHLLGKKPETSTIPFIFLTAKTERSDVRKGMDMGADDYITKPFDKTELLNAVESRFRKSASIKKEYERTPEGLTTFIGEVNGADAMNKFTGGKKIKAFKKKENIYREGDYPRGMYFLNKGKIKVFKIHDFGKELITELLKEGDFFGYTALLEEKDHSDNAQALEDSEVTFIPREEFFALVYHNQGIAKKFLQILTRNLSDQQEHLLELAYSSVRKRVAEALLLLQKKYSESGEKQPFSISVSREDLANMVGTATESLIRTLSDFKGEQLIEIKDGRIFIINEKKLRELKG